MKKFIIIATALVMAVLAQAGSMSWFTVEAFFYLPDEDGTPKSATNEKATGVLAYLFAGDVKDTVQAHIDAGTFGTEMIPQAYAHAYTTGKGKLAKVLEGENSEGYYKYTSIIFDTDDFATAQYYQLVSEEFFTGGVGDLLIQFHDFGGPTIKWSKLPTAVPEPVFMGIFATAMVAVMLRRQKNIA